MLNKKLVFLAILIISLISISAVSAADDAASDILSTDSNDNLILEDINEDVSAIDVENDEIVLDDNDVDELISNTNDDTSLKDGEVGSFADLNATINGNEDTEITLHSDYTFNGTTTDDTPFKNGIIINRTMTIDGNGYTFSGNNLSRIFEVTADNVVLRNFNFVNGNSTDRGGAIRWSGNNGTVDGCNFTNNTARFGGAIYFGSSGKVVDSIFEENTVEKNYQNDGYGGAIYFEGAGEVIGSTFNKNQAKGMNYFGPYWDEDYYSEESQFNRGGAIFFRDEGDVIGSTFNQNEAFQGSAIYSADKRLDVRDSEFIDNKGSFGGLYFWAIHDIKGWYAEDSPTNPHYITVGFDYPGDNYINAIHNFETKPRNVHGNITLSNVTYWVGEIVNSDDGYPIKNCTYAPLILTVIDSEGNEILNDIIMTNGTSVTYDPFQLDYTEGIYYNLTHEDDEHYSYWYFAMTLSEARNPSSVVINTVESEFNYDDCTIDFAVENRTLINVRVTNENGDVVFDKNTTEDSISLDVPAYDGYYNVTVYNFGNLYFIPSSDSKLIKIFPTNSAINITPIDDIAYNEKINVEINGENLTTVNVTVYDKDRNVVFSQNITGTTIELPVLDVGEYNITVINYGNESIMGCENSTIFKVIKANNNVLVSVGDVTYGDKAIIVISADVDGEYAVNINGTTKKVNVVNGAGKVSLSLKPGNYLAKASFDNSNYDSAITNATFKVLKATTKISASAVTTTYNVNKNLVITLKDNKGKAVSGVKLTVNLGGNKKYTTDKNGQVKVNVAKLVPKTYTAKISFAGNDIYKAASTTAKVTVKKATPKVTAKAKTFKFEDKAKKYTITLKDNKGKVLKNKKVTLKVNGKTYAAKTNSKGVATFKLTKLNKKGKYTAAITYAGDKYYNKLNKKAKITVKAPAWKTVAKGSKDKATVKKIQQALKNNGYYLTYKGHYLKIDGIYKGCTERSVKQFQKAKKLKVTGKVDYATAKKLKIVS